MSQVSDIDNEEDLLHQVKLSSSQQTTSSLVHLASPSRAQHASPSHDNSSFHPTHLMDSQDPFGMKLVDYDPQIII